MPTPIHLIPDAPSELAADGETDSRKYQLAQELTRQGKEPRCCGRALVTFERCEQGDQRPSGIAGWGSLKISFYADPDATGIEDPTELFIDGGRYGFSRAMLFHPGGSRSLAERTEELHRSGLVPDISDTSHASLPFTLRIKLAIDAADLQGLIDGGAPADEYSSVSRLISISVPSALGLEEIALVVREHFRSIYGSECIPERAHVIPALARSIRTILEHEQRRAGPE